MKDGFYKSLNEEKGAQRKAGEGSRDVCKKVGRGRGRGEERTSPTGTESRQGRMDHVTEMFEPKGSPVLWTRCGSLFSSLLKPVTKRGTKRGY